MKLDTKAFTLTVAIVWGGAVLMAGITQQPRKHQHHQSDLERLCGCLPGSGGFHIPGLRRTADSVEHRCCHPLRRYRRRVWWIGYRCDLQSPGRGARRRKAARGREHLKPNVLTTKGTKPTKRGGGGALKGLGPSSPGCRRSDSAAETPGISRCLRTWRRGVANDQCRHHLRCPVERRQVSCPYPSKRRNN